MYKNGTKGDFIKHYDKLQPQLNISSPNSLKIISNKNICFIHKGGLKLKLDTLENIIESILFEHEEASKTVILQRKEEEKRFKAYASGKEC